MADGCARLRRGESRARRSARAQRQGGYALIIAGSFAACEFMESDSKRSLVAYRGLTTWVATGAVDIESRSVAPATRYRPLL